MQSAVVGLVNIIAIKYDGNELQSQVQQWGTETTQFERAIGKELYDEVKIGLLWPSTTGKLRALFMFVGGRY
eukprot:1811637-Lingulodinium_polyedra.AAC.1